MNIVIVGAGTIGFSIARLLSKSGHNIVLIDEDPLKLELPSQKLDVGVRCGSGTDWTLLEELKERFSDCILAVTQSDEVNLCVCSLAKSIGFSQTVARVRNPCFFQDAHIDIKKIFQIDYFISPEWSVAHDLHRSMAYSNALATEQFAHGAVYMRTFILTDSWKYSERNLENLNLPKGVVIAVVAREESSGRKIIIPRGKDRLLPGDEVTVIGEAQVVSKIHLFFNLFEKKVFSVVIIGGNLVAIHLARLLERSGIHVSLIDQNKQKCKELSEQLEDITILYTESIDEHFLASEKIQDKDCVVVCSDDDTKNIYLSLILKKSGCKRILGCIGSPTYSAVSLEAGMDLVLSPRDSAANSVLSILQKDRFASIVSLYDDEVEVVELKVSLNAEIAGLPLSVLGERLPKDFLIAVIQNRGKILVAHGSSVLSPGDTVIAIMKSGNLHELDRYF